MNNPTLRTPSNCAPVLAIVLALGAVLFAIAPRHAAAQNAVPNVAVALPGGLPAGAVSLIGQTDDPSYSFNVSQGVRRIVVGPWPTGAPLTTATTYSPLGQLQLAIDVTEVEGIGYFPIVVTVLQQASATAEKEVDVRIYAGSLRDGGRALALDSRLVIKRGDKSASGRVLIPKYQDWHLWGWETRVDGLRDPALSVKDAGWGWQPQVSGASVWILPSANDYTGRLKRRIEQLVGGQTIPEFKAVPPNELPTDWLAYSSADLIVMLPEDLSKLVADQPERARTLLRWIRAGGNLWLMRAGNDWESLPGIDAALTTQVVENKGGFTQSTGAGAVSEAASKKTDPFADGRWRRPAVGATAVEAVSGALLLSEISVEQVEAKPKQPPGTLTPVQTPPATAAGNLLPKDASRWYAVRGYGFGLIAAFRTSIDWGHLTSQAPPEVLSNTIISPRLNWIDRHGNHPNDPNFQFNNWLIPEVGVAPVVQFQVLLTLFALAIGPLNYWLLVRRGRLPMMLATIPVAALATTVLLFAYGLLADGMGVRLRARTLTMLDQRAGESATWSRYSYYAGLAPRRGLVAEPETAVYPVLPTWASEFSRGGGLLRVLAWNDERQHLRSGWVSSRTPTQYLTTSARACDKRLEIRPAEGALRLTNRLGVGVTMLLVQDDDGQLFWCENLAEGASQLVPRTDMSAIGIKLRRQFTDHFPEYPPGADPNSLGMNSSYASALSKNLMEANLDALNSPGVESWGDRTYLAITDRPVSVDLVAVDAIEEDSFHVIRGEW